MVGRRRGFFAESLAWLLLLLGLGAAGAELTLESRGCLIIEGQGGGTSLVSILLAGVAFAVIGRLLTARRPENRVSWLLAWLGAGLPILMLTGMYTNCEIQGFLPLPWVSLVAWLDMNFGVLVITPMFVLLPAWFPDGRFMSRRWASLIWSMLIAIFLLTFLTALVPGFLNNGMGAAPVQNPFGVHSAFLERISPLLITGLPVILSLACLLAILSFISRFRRATGETRQQFKWFAAFLSTVVVIHIAGFEIGGTLVYPAIFEHWSYMVILAFSFGGFPIVIGLTIFKYRLYDIDFIIRRTISYGLLTALLALAYFGGIVSLQRILNPLTVEADIPFVTVLTTLGIAALFNPLRTRTQDIIDRRFYRAKYDAERTLDQFAATARDEVGLERLAGELLGVAEDLMQPEAASLWLREPEIRPGKNKFM